MSAPDEGRRVVLVRHAQTAWSLTGRHTGRTDLELTDAGRDRAAAVGARLAGWRFDRVLTSPLRRAQHTCELAGFGARAAVRDDLAEWDYGDYEGRTTADVRRDDPTWNLWADGAPGGESPADVQQRADRVVAELAAADGDTVVFSHGHLLRALAARWLALPVATGGRLLLGTAAICVLGHGRDGRALHTWNETGHLEHP